MDRQRLAEGKKNKRGFRPLRTVPSTAPRLAPGPFGPLPGENKDPWEGELRHGQDSLLRARGSTGGSTKTPADTTGNNWVFDHGFFIILNLAVGGDWPGAPDGTTIFPQKLVIDYIHVCQK